MHRSRLRIEPCCAAGRWSPPHDPLLETAHYRKSILAREPESNQLKHSHLGQHLARDLTAAHNAYVLRQTAHGKPHPHVNLSSGHTCMVQLNKCTMDEFEQF